MGKVIKILFGIIFLVIMVSSCQKADKNINSSSVYMNKDLDKEAQVNSTSENRAAEDTLGQESNKENTIDNRIEDDKLRKLEQEKSSKSELLKRLEQKGITEKMRNTLENLGFDKEEMLSLAQEQIDIIFAPGTHLDGGGFDFFACSEEEQNRLLEQGIDSEKSMILYNLSYTYEDMTQISQEELDFIFPNTELIANLENLGVSKERIDDLISKGSTYREIIKDALSKKY